MNSTLHCEVHSSMQQGSINRINMMSDSWQYLNNVSGNPGIWFFGIVFIRIVPVPKNSSRVHNIINDLIIVILKGDYLNIKHTSVHQNCQIDNQNNAWMVSALWCVPLWHLSNIYMAYSLHIGFINSFGWVLEMLKTPSSILTQFWYYR